MSKLQLFFTSLVAALPGAALSYVLVMSFLGYADKSSGGMKGLVGFTLLLSIVVAVLPVMVLVTGGPRTETPAKKKDDKSSDAVAGDDDADMAASDELATMSDEVETLGDSADDLELASSGSIDVFEDDIERESKRS